MKLEGLCSQTGMAILLGWSREYHCCFLPHHSTSAAML